MLNERQLRWRFQPLLSLMLYAATSYSKQREIPVREKNYDSNFPSGAGAQHQILLTAHEELSLLAFKSF